MVKPGGRGAGMRPPGDSVKFSPSLGKDGVRHFFDAATTAVGTLKYRDKRETVPTTVAGVIARVIGVYPDGQKRIMYEFSKTVPLDETVEDFLKHNELVRTGADMAEHSGHNSKEKG